MHRSTNLLLILFCFFNLSTHAQKHDAPVYDFYGSITKNIKIAFKPVAVMIKVDVNKEGQVSSIDLSDNAEADFRKQFEAARPKLNMEALNSYITLNKIKARSFMIPYYVTTDADKNKPHNEPLLTTFNGKNFKNKATILSPIKATYSVTTTTTTTTITKTL